MVGELENSVHFVLHIAEFCLNCKYHIVFRENHAELTESTVAAEAFTGIAPELEAVAGTPVGSAVYGIVGYGRGCVFHPFFRKETLALPHTFVDVEKTELDDIVGADVESAAAFVCAVENAVPADIGDFEREEELHSEVVDQLHAGDLFDNAGKEAGGAGVIGKVGAGLEFYFLCKKLSGSVAAVLHGIENAELVTCVHGEDVFEAHFSQVVRNLIGELIREKIDNTVLETEFSLVNQESDRRGAEAL
jgi:hypothetical protein